MTDKYSNIPRRCKKCGGNLFLDDGEITSLQCGARYQPEESLTAPEGVSGFGHGSPAEHKPVSSTPQPLPPERPMLPKPVAPGKKPIAGRKKRRPSYYRRKRDSILGILTNQNPGDTWYAPHEITFHYRQLPFLLYNLSLLREGRYPADPKETGYDDIRVFQKHQQRQKAYFELPVMLAAEVERRLETCGLDGLLALTYYCHHLDVVAVGRYYRIDSVTVFRRIEGVLRFISGWHFRHGKQYRRWNEQKKKTVEK